MAKSKGDKHKNRKLSLKPLKFAEAVKDILQVKPEDKKPEVEIAESSK
jgi:hypothetical protein